MPNSYSTIEDAAAAAIFRAVAKNSAEESGTGLFRNPDGTFSFWDPANAYAGTEKATHAAQFDYPSGTEALAHNHPYQRNIYRGASGQDVAVADQLEMPSFIGSQPPNIETPSSVEVLRYVPGQTPTETFRSTNGVKRVSPGEEVLAQFPIDEWQAYWDTRLGTNDAPKFAAEREQVQQNINAMQASSPAAIINAAVPPRPITQLPVPDRGGVPTRIEARQEVGATRQPALEDMSHSELYLQRGAAAPEDQAMIAPFEHRAFAREYIEEKPWMAAAMPFLIPGYQAAKAVGLQGARTNPSLDQMFAGLQGTGEGLRNWWNSRTDPVDENRRINRLLTRKRAQENE